MEQKNNDSRRDVLKKGVKAAAFALPIMTTFKLADCRVKASTGKIYMCGQFKD